MNRSDFEIEICAGNIQSVIAADKGGANRVELCDNLIEGGTTPSIGTIVLAKEVSGIEVFPIIRPRGGNFVYDDVELKIMLYDIKHAVANGADGLVIGALNANGTINTDQCGRMIETARGLPVTFHRAFDHCRDPFEALQKLISMGVSRLLTSGQKNKVFEGAELIAQLQKEAGDRLKVMPGGGIDENNITELAKITGVKCFHASLRDVYNQELVYGRNEILFNGTKDLPENQIKVSNENRIKSIINQLENV